MLMICYLVYSSRVTQLGAYSYAILILGLGLDDY